jgi:nitrite reductase/ring-hydroxylating ferredoxin subunit
MRRVDMAESADVREGEVLVARVEGLVRILTRIRGRAYAAENRCLHLG